MFLKEKSLVLEQTYRFNNIENLQLQPELKKSVSRPGFNRFIYQNQLSKLLKGSITSLRQTGRDWGIE
jgi:hypothetical protein